MVTPPVGIVNAATAQLPVNRDRVGEIWIENAADLTNWTMAYLVNRTDAFGCYLPLDKREKQTAYTEKQRKLTKAILNRHFEGRDPGHIVGLHAIQHDKVSGAGGVDACWSRFLSVDIDRHDESIDPKATEKAAITLWGRLRQFGFDPLLIDSNGDGGFHLTVIFREAMPTEKVFAFGRWLVQDWKALGLTQDPETFPKQASVKSGFYGNWIRLPGRHHKRDHYSRIWNGTKWLEGVLAIRAILAKQGDDPDLVLPEYVITKPVRKAKRSDLANDASRDAQIAFEALKHLDHSMDYEPWVAVGMSLTALGREGLRLWDDWSQGSEKYEEGVCDRKWNSFHGSGRGLGTLIQMAQTNGFQHPAKQPRVKPARQAEAEKPRLKIADDGGGNDDEGEPPPKNDRPQFLGNCDDLPKFRNHHSIFFTDPDGEQKSRVVPHHISQIAATLETITPGWPKRIAKKLFVPTAALKPNYLMSSTQLFSWIWPQSWIEWHKGPKLVSQEAFYEHLRNTVDDYDLIETMPHTPPIPGVYYLHPDLPQATGKLDELVDRFHPDSAVDRELLKSLIITPSWGGPLGERPAFLITGKDYDERQGRGMGKSTLLDLIANDLYGGSIDVSQKNDMDDVKKRILSGEKLDVRILRLDNIKTHKFSWAELESFITARSISGHGLYVGEVQRPNTFTCFITLNGASLSSDMAERVVTIKLGRPASKPNWKGETQQFITEHRWSILADIAAFLSRLPGELTPKVRWADWQIAVLSKLSDPEQCQAVFLERQGAMNEGNADRDLVRDYLVKCFKEEGFEADESLLLVPSLDMAQMVSEATRHHYATNTASAFLRELCIPEIIKSNERCRRGWIWNGTRSTVQEPRDFLYKNTQRPKPVDRLGTF